ncbi:MAG: 50S ribosomal protein L18 [Anaerolineales bacterium]|nr:50S ribosomal protein L18 [Anaerolineales bacterium]
MAKQKSRAEARKRRHLRVRKHLSGTSERPRLNVFRSLSEIYAQVINDEEGITLVAASSIDKELRPNMKGKSKTDQAQIVGEAIAERAKAQGISTVVFDRGGFRYIGRVKALADSARKGGLDF